MSDLLKSLLKTMRDDNDRHSNDPALDNYSLYNCMKVEQRMICAKRAFNEESRDLILESEDLDIEKMKLTIKMTISQFPTNDKMVIRSAPAPHHK